MGEMAGSASRDLKCILTSRRRSFAPGVSENNRAIGDTSLGQTQGGIRTPPFGVVCAMGGVGRSDMGEMAGSASRDLKCILTSRRRSFAPGVSENNRAIGDTSLGQTQGGIRTPPFGVVCAMGGVGRSDECREHRK